MTFNRIVDAFGAVALVILGTFVLRLKPRTPANVAFGVFSIAFPLGFLYNLSDGGANPFFSFTWPLSAVALLVATAAVFAVVATVPRRVAGRERVVLLALAAVAVLYFFVSLWIRVPLVRPFVGGLPLWLVLSVHTVFSTYAALATALLLCAGFLAYRLHAPDAEDRRADRLGLAAVALGAWPAYHAGNLLLSVTQSRSLGMDGGVASALVLVVAAAWLAAGARTGRARTGAVVALVLLSVWFLGALMRVLPGGFVSGNEFGAYGFVRVAAVAVLAYAVLRSQLLGVDVQLRFAISRSSVAAVFITVFFVASEGAQLLFGQGNAAIGLVAAGALVFAMAPLQRAADRLAEKAVPIAEAVSSAGVADPRPAAAYRAAVRAAMRDGRVTRREEVHLAEVAEHLGLGPRDAASLRHEVEDEARAAAGRAGPD